MPAKKATPKKITGKKTGTKPTTRKRRGPAEPRGPEASATALGLDDASIADVVSRIAALKGTALAAYRDPYGGTSLVTICLGFGILMSIHTHKKLVQS